VSLVQNLSRMLACAVLWLFQIRNECICVDEEVSSKGSRESQFDVGKCNLARRALGLDVVCKQ